MFLHVLPLRARLSLLWISIRVPSVFHPSLKDLLLRYFQGRVFDRWRRNKLWEVRRVFDDAPPRENRGTRCVFATQPTRLLFDQAAADLAGQIAAIWIGEEKGVRNRKTTSCRDCSKVTGANS